MRTMPSRAAPVAATLLLLALAGSLPPASAQEPGVVHKEDAKNDVTFSAQQVNSPNLPDNEVTSYVDIHTLTVTDVDEETLEVRLKTGTPFVVMNGQKLQTYGIEEVYHQVFFSIPGAGGQPVQAQVNVRSIHVHVENNTPSKGFLVVYASLCFPSSLQQYQYSCEYGGNQLPVSADGGVLVARIPKEKLTQVGQEGERTRNANLPGRLFPGDVLTDVYARAFLRPFFTGGGFLEVARFIDRAPDSGGLQITLRFGSPAPDLKMSVPQAAVILGQENQVPVLVQNLGTHKRIVNLTVDRLTADQPWTASVTPSVTLGAGKSANVTLRVTPPPAGTSDRLTAVLKLRATILTEPGTIAIARLGLVAAPPLDRDHSTYFVVGRQWNSFFGLPFPFLAWGEGGLTRSETDARFATATSFAMSPSFGTSSGVTSFAFQSSLRSDPIPNAAVIRPGEPAQAVVDIEAPYPAAATLAITGQFGPQLLFQTQKTITLAAGSNKIPFDVPILPSVQRLDPSNGTLRVDIRLSVQGADGAPYLTSYFGVNGPKIVPKTTFVRLPVDREVPAVQAATAKVALSPAEELDGFVNPGRVQVVELDVRNEEPREMTLQLEALNVTEGWDVAVKPGARLRLASQDAVHVGVLIKAPADAKEGDALKFRLVVRDVVNDTLVAGQWIRSIVTRGVEIENETFEVAQDDAKKLDVPSGKSPGLGLLAALAATAAAGLLGRRRRAA
ncbi:MAG: hypothetical protein HYT80_02095 [Euryarchaeota archaeon]|nr:hypothetical protein [Euryarchaeota archaeon]